MWYHGLSVFPENKETIELVKFISRYGIGGDILNVPHPMSFCATWANSKLGDGYSIYTNAILPDESKVKSKTLTDGFGGNCIFSFAAKVAFSKGESALNRQEKMFVNVKAAVDKLAKSYKVFFIRLPIFYLELDKYTEFDTLGVGYLLDVDPISGWIWMTNNADLYNADSVSKSSKTFTGGDKIRAVLKQCIPLRYMVDQTHTGAAKYYSTLNSWPNVKFKLGFSPKVNTAGVVSTGELNSFEGVVIGPGRTKTSTGDPFAKADLAAKSKMNFTAPVSVPSSAVTKKVDKFAAAVKTAPTVKKSVSTNVSSSILTGLK